MHIHYLQHIPLEDPAACLDWARERNIILTSTHLYRDANFPDPDSFDGLLIMGGDMSVYEEDKFPWLTAEKAWIKQVIATGKPVLGICLGSQLLADVLGAEVFPNTEKEIGWFPIDLTAEARKTELFRSWPSPVPVFHWHGDTFTLPEGAAPIASSEATKHQGFILDNVLALQFHPELTAGQIIRFAAEFPEDLIPAAHVQDAETIAALSNQHEKKTLDLMYDLLDRFYLKRE